MIDAFLLKKLISALVHLIPGAFIVLLLSLIGRRWWPRLCGALSIVICCVLIAGTVPPISNYFVTKLENQFPVLPIAPPDTLLILVLGTGHMYVEGRPPNSVLSASALSRVVEGVRLWKTEPDSYLVVSGASFGDVLSHAAALQSMALELGVPTEHIILLDQTRDTEEEIAKVLDTLNELTVARQPDGASDTARQRVVITSSAIHIPRAAMLIEERDAIYTMAPTDYLASDAPWYRPSGSHLRRLDRVVHEWLGIAWIQVRRLITQ